MRWHIILLITELAAARRASASTFDAEAYETVLRDLESKRLVLRDRYRQASSVAERRALRQRARELVLTALTDDIFPVWLGTPWGLGPSSTAIRPHQAGKVVGCSYFVTAALLNAGLRLSSRARFAQAPSLLMQRALTADPRQLRRMAGMPMPRLERRLLAMGDGVYIIGLNIHTGFLVVRHRQVRVVHASYTPPQEVVDEPLGTSRVMANSAQRGYVVTPLFADDRLVDHWLAGRPVPAPHWPPPRGSR
jgi:hypothetical protein